ncbi:BA14K family protein [Rhizobium sp. F40D2]|uniref:BA14K family protein n=1 Tax=Rhizobium sp. F40D2 TaxID=3453141 RepID=UPI003F23DDF2
MKIDAPINEPAAADHATTAWCAARYTSDREEDNSYQPYAGPRHRRFLLRMQISHRLKARMVTVSRLDKVVAAETISYRPLQSRIRSDDVRALHSWDWPQEALRFRLQLAFRNMKCVGEARRSYFPRSGQFESLDSIWVSSFKVARRPAHRDGLRKINVGTASTILQYLAGGAG